MKILLLGANGQLGQSIVKRAKSHLIAALSKEELDISDREKVYTKIDELKPDIVINAAAFTDVNLAEAYPMEAKKINTYGPKYLADACAINNTPIIHISTDYVFDGKKTSAYLPSDDTNPIGIYGRTKLDGEFYINKYKFGYIIRTSWLFSEYGSNFFKTMIALTNKSDEINVVSDEIGCPTYAGDLADAIILSTQSIASGRLAPAIYHFASSNPCSWYEFASSILKEGHVQNKLKKLPLIKPINGSVYHKNYDVRPKYSALDSSKLCQHLGISLPNWEIAILKLFSAGN
ncbi:dTDP-4-dehydrorhamnose reductase [Gammaproteobacteria bacterium]|nr:dTDP-4-dehydrorhamnose reductase [Gammaproteobacteria bacterium]